MSENGRMMELLTQSKMLISEEKYEKAIEYLDRAEEIDNMVEEIYLQKGLAYANLEDYKNAKIQYQKVLKINKKEGIAYFHLGNLELLEGNSAQGIEYYNNAIVYGFDDAQVYFSLGLQYEENGEDDFALRNYAKALMKDPQRADIRIRRIRLFAKNNHKEEALNEASNLILSNPDVFEGYHFKFLLYSEMKKYEEALQVIEDAKEMFPKDVNFIIDEATLAQERGNDEEALKLLDEAEKYEDIDPLEKRKIEMERAQIYANKQDLERTIMYLERARDCVEKEGEDTVDIESTYLLMNCYINNQQFEKMLECARKLKKTKVENYYTLTAPFYEGLSLKRLQKDEASTYLKEAVEFYREQTMTNPGNLDAYFFRVMCLNELQEFDKSLELLKFLEDIKGDLPQVKELREATETKKKAIAQ